MPSNGLVYLTRVTFTSTTSVTIDNVFTSTYTYYLLRGITNGQTNGTTEGFFRSSGVDDTSGYEYQYLNGDTSYTSSGAASNQIERPLGEGSSVSTQYTCWETWIGFPATAVPTTSWNTGNYAVAGNIGWSAFMTNEQSNTAFNGIRFRPNTGGGSFSGYVVVYGLAK